MFFGQPNWLYGATYQNESIIACMHSNSIKRFPIANTKDVSIPTLLFKPKNTESTYLASDDNYFYHSDYKNHSVTCYDLKEKICGHLNMSYCENPVALYVWIQIKTFM